MGELAAEQERKETAVSLIHESFSDSPFEKSHLRLFIAATICLGCVCTIQGSTAFAEQELNPKFAASLTNFRDAVGVSYQANLNVVRSVIYEGFPDLRSQATGSRKMTQNPYENRVEKHTVGLFRLGDAFDFTDRRERSGTGTFEQKGEAELRYMWTEDKRWVAFTRTINVEAGDAPGVAHVHTDSDAKDIHMAQALCGRELLLGAFVGDIRSVHDSILENVAEIRGVEELDYSGRKAWSVDWHSEQGNYDVIFDSETGFILHAHIEKTGETLWYNTGAQMRDRSRFPLGEPGTGNDAIPEKRVIEYDAVLSPSNSTLLVSGATMVLTTEFEGGQRTVTKDEIDLVDFRRDPDFDKLGAFQIGTLPEGTLVVDANLTTTDFEIRGGQIVPKMALGAEESLKKLVTEISTNKPSEIQGSENEGKPSNLSSSVQIDRFEAGEDKKYLWAGIGCAILVGCIGLVFKLSWA